jgi:hypothetical protein
MAAKLKVFITSDGLTDYVVAVSSKSKALAAWGVRQDVFKEGAAHQTDDPVLVKAATAKPGEVLRRPAGTRDKLAKLKPAKAAKPSGPTKAQLKKVATLEKQLADLDADHDRDADALERARADLDRREEALHARHEARRAKLEAALDAAREAAT